MSELSAVAELDEPSTGSASAPFGAEGRQQSMEPSSLPFDSPGSSRYRSNDVVSGFLGLPMLRQVGLLVGFASVITFSILIVMWSQSPDYRPLYSNLDPGQASEIARVLEEGGVRFTVEPETGMVLVSASDIHEARMKIAAADVIATKDTGYLILDQEQELGTSQFMETARYRRAIIGAVMGLIHVMGNLNEPEKIGAGVATAFVATIYGVGFANLLLYPIAGKLKGLLQLQDRQQIMALEGMVAIAEGEHPSVIEMRLLSMAGLGS